LTSPVIYSEGRAQANPANEHKQEDYMSDTFEQTINDFIAELSASVGPPIEIVEISTPEAPPSAL